MLPNSKILNYTNSSSLFILFRVITTFVFLLFIYLNTTKICNLHKIYVRYILYYIKIVKKGITTTRKQKKKCKNNKKTR
jgi:Ca2+/Na+ antiporter